MRDSLLLSGLVLGVLMVALWLLGPTVVDLFGSILAPLAALR